MAILEQRREQEAKETILRLGEKHFGPPNESAKVKLNAVTDDIAYLQELQNRIFDVSTWQELFTEN